LSQNEKISKAGRLDRALDLKTRGLTDSEISQRMSEEGYAHVSLRTINRLLNGVEAELFVDNLLRLQLRDITISDTALRLKYRDKILEKLMPRQTQPVAITGPVAPIFEIGLKDIGPKPENEV
jgi:hypothetical protein